jgi:hypothetical protein
MNGTDAPATPVRPKRHGRTLGLFLLSLVALDAIILLNRESWNRYSPDDYTARVEGCAQHPRDLVFLGGSTVAESIDPTLIETIPWRDSDLNTLYAVGLSGGTTSDFYFALQRACPTPPRVLVYGMTASDINDSRHEPHGPHSLMSWADVQDWRTTRPDAAEWVTRHFIRGKLNKVWSAYRYRHGIQMWAAWQADQLAPGCCPETTAEAARHRASSDALAAGTGYAPTKYFAERAYSEMKAGGWVQPPFEYLARYRTGSHLRYLQRIIDWCAERNTTLILVDMPTTADLLDRHPKEFAEYRLRLAEFAEKSRIPVIRATADRTGLDDRHFADLIHLNREGAERFTPWLKAELAQLGTTRPEPALAVTGVALSGARR